MGRKKGGKNKTTALVPNKVGRPKSPLTREKLETLAKFGALQDDMAAIFEVDRYTIARFVRTEYGCNFVTFRRAQMAKLKYSFINKVYKIIEHDLERTLIYNTKLNTQLIMFALKNLAGWKDKIETTEVEADGNDKPTVVFAFSDEVQKKEEDSESDEDIEEGDDSIIDIEIEQNETE